MSFQFSAPVRNAALDTIEATVGTAPTLTIRTGSVPATADAAATGTVLATIVLPSDWMAAASAGSKAIAGGPWQDAAADATGTASYFRITGAGGVIQGTVGTSGADMIVDSVSFTAGQQFNVTAFTLSFAA